VIFGQNLRLPLYFQLLTSRYTLSLEGLPIARLSYVTSERSEGGKNTSKGEVTGIQMTTTMAWAQESHEEAKYDEEKRSMRKERMPARRTTRRRVGTDTNVYRKFSLLSFSCIALLIACFSDCWTVACCSLSLLTASAFWVRTTGPCTSWAWSWPRHSRQRWPPRNTSPRRTDADRIIVIAWWKSEKWTCLDCCYVICFRVSSLLYPLFSSLFSIIFASLRNKRGFGWAWSQTRSPAECFPSNYSAQFLAN
jgi:hypothetical protein